MTWGRIKNVARLGRTTSRTSALPSVPLVFALVSLTFAFLALREPVALTDWHVSPDGSDSNPGTFPLPFKTIQKAVNVAQPGDSIKVHAGTYPEFVKINPVNSGTQSQRITLIAAGDGIARVQPALSSVLCTNKEPTTERAIQILAGADDWTIEDLTIIGGVLITGTKASLDGKPDTLGAHAKDRSLPGRANYDPEGAKTTLALLGSDGADRIKLFRNKMTRRGVLAQAARYGSIVDNEIGPINCGIGAGILLRKFSDGWQVRSNFVHDIAKGPNHWMSEGIRHLSGSSYNTTYGNTIEDLLGDGRGITTDVNSNWNRIERNVVRRAAQGLNEQLGNWGNKWLRNRAENSRNYGMNIFQNGADQPSPTAQTPSYMLVQCNVATGSGKVELNIGGVKNSTFKSNAFATVTLSNYLRNYWTSAGNTWNGSSNPPGRTPPQVFCP